MSGPGAAEAAVQRLTSEARALLLERAGDGAVLVGIGWATVDLDRAALELGARLGTTTADPEPADPEPAQTEPAQVEHARADAASPRRRAPELADPALGARARIVAMAGSRAGGAPILVLLEPDREGPLAAFLARHGEGIAAVYAYFPTDELSPPRPAIIPGPLGPARRRGGGREGPFLIEVMGRPREGL